MTRTKSWLKWGVVLVVLAVIALGVARLVAKREAAKQALALAQTTKQDTPVELAASDVLTARVISLAQGLPVYSVTGKLRVAVASA